MLDRDSRWKVVEVGDRLETELGWIDELKETASGDIRCRVDSGPVARNLGIVRWEKAAQSKW